MTNRGIEVTRPSVTCKNGNVLYDPATNPDILAGVHVIRERFTAEYESNPDLYSAQDLEMINQNDFFIRRFLYPNDLDTDQSYTQFKDWMAWRKRTGLNEMTFPGTFYGVASQFIYSTDRQGSPFLVNRTRAHHKIDSLDQEMRDFMIKNLDLLDQKAGREGGWGIVFDAQSSGFSNIDMSITHCMFDTLRNYYPHGVRYIIVYELPWLLQGVWKLTLKLLPKEQSSLFRFYNRGNISELIDPAHLPDFMGGTCRKDYRQAPNGCPTEQQLGWTDEQINALNKVYQKNLSL